MMKLGLRLGFNISASCPTIELTVGQMKVSFANYLSSSCDLKLIFFS